MSRLKKILIGAGAITVLLLGLGLTTLWWGFRHSEFEFPGPGLEDFSAHLAGSYILFRPSAHDVSIVSESGSITSSPSIPSEVIQCATDGRFILAKRLPYGGAAHDYWLLDTDAPKALGPLTEIDFTGLRARLGVSPELVLRDVETFRPPEPSSKRE